MAQKNKDKFEQLGTKIDPAMAEVLDKVCNALQVDVYHLLQWFCYTLIRAAAPVHGLDPRIQKLMAMMECDYGWQEAFNMVDKSKFEVEQCVLILSQKGKEGFGAVMINRPFFKQATQTECVDDIFERITEVTMPGVYRRLRDMGRQMECESQMEVLLTMLEHQGKLNAEADMADEGPQMGEHTDSGRLYAYGKKTKAKQHRTIDSYAEDKRTFFDDLDERPDMEVESWEGEHRQHDVMPEDVEEDDV